MDDKSSCTILVVDDEPANVFLLTSILEHNNFNVDSVSDGKKCMEYLEKNLPDVILLDIMMPGITGIEVLNKITSHKNLKDIPVIMVSSKTSSKDVEEALNQGAIDYLKKPIDEIELLARINVAIRIKNNEEKLRELVKAQEEFVRIISHDLRSPFSTINGFAEMMAFDENLNSEQKEALNFIIEASNYSVEYFNKLLNWTKLGASEINLVKTSINLFSLVQSCTTLYSKKASEKKIDFKIDIDKDLQVNADDVFFRQLINNLLNNAIKFTEAEGQIRIFTSRTSDHLKLSVWDNGVGIKNTTPEEMFNKSVNISTRGTSGEKGTGIGLSICNKIIKAHGFEITFISNPGKGTEFIILIPINEIPV